MFLLKVRLVGEDPGRPESVIVRPEQRERLGVEGGCQGPLSLDVARMGRLMTHPSSERQQVKRAGHGQRCLDPTRQLKALFARGRGA